MNRAGSRSGQTMTEMIIIVALIAIASIIVVGLFGDQIRHTFSRLAGGLAGEQVAQQSQASTIQAQMGKGMADFDTNVK